MSPTPSENSRSEATTLPSVQAPVARTAPDDFSSLCRSTGSEQQPGEVERIQRRLEELSTVVTEGSLFARSCRELAADNDDLVLCMVKLGELLRLEAGEEPINDSMAASALADFCYVACYSSEHSRTQSLPLSFVYLTALKLMKTYTPGLLTPPPAEGDALLVLFESLIRFHDPILWWHVTRGGTQSWTLGETQDRLRSLFAAPLSRRGHPEVCQTLWSRLAREWDVVDAVFAALAWVLQHSDELRKIGDVRVNGSAVLSLVSTGEVDDILQRAASLKAFTPKSVLRALQHAICGQDSDGTSQKGAPCLLVGPDDALAASDGFNSGQLCVLVDVRSPYTRRLQPSLKGSMVFEPESAKSGQIATFVNRAIATQRAYAGRELPNGKSGCVMLLLYNEDGSYPADSSLVTVISLLIEAGVPGVALLQGGFAAVAELRGDQPLPSNKELLIGQVTETISSLQETAGESLRLATERFQGTRAQTVTKLDEVRLRLGDVTSTAAANVRTQSDSLAATANATIGKLRDMTSDPTSWWGQASTGFKSVATRVQQVVTSQSPDGTSQSVGSATEAPREYAVEAPPSLSFDRAPLPPAFAPPPHGSTIDINETERK